MRSEVELRGLVRKTVRTISAACKKDQDFGSVPFTTSPGKLHRKICKQVEQRLGSRLVERLEVGTKRKPGTVFLYWGVGANEFKEWPVLYLSAIENGFEYVSPWLYISIHASTQLVKRTRARDGEAVMQELGPAVEVWVRRWAGGGDYGLGAEDSWLRTDNGVGIIQCSEELRVKAGCTHFVTTWIDCQAIANPSLKKYWMKNPTGAVGEGHGHTTK